MTLFNIKDSRDHKNKIVRSASRGFFYYLATIYIVCFIAIGSAFIGGLAQKSSTQQGMNVTMEFFHNHGVGATLCLALLICGSYFSARYISQKDKESQTDITAQRIIDDTHDYELKKKEEHDKLIAYRVSVTPKISNVMKDLIIDTGAAKVAVFELHNGGNSITGIPFLYADMNYEEAKDQAMLTIDEYKNVNLNKYPLICNHFQDGSWYGTTEALAEEDQKLADKLNAIGATYCVMMVIHGVDRPVGFLNIYFTGEHESSREILSKANIAVQKISHLLDKSYIIKSNAIRA